MKKAIIFFTRVPLPGLTKTRLIKDFSSQEACRIHEIMLKSIFKSIKETNADVFIYINPIEKKEVLFGLIGENNYYPQIGQNLNEKMKNAIFDVLDLGYDKVILLGSDLIGIDRDYLENAFELLKDKDIVLGPVEDGGYCLIGMKKKESSPFEETKLSHGRVLENLIDRIEREDLTYGLLKEIFDVDEIDDFYKVTGNKKDIDEFERRVKWARKKWPVQVRNV